MSTRSGRGVTIFPRLIYYGCLLSGVCPSTVSSGVLLSLTPDASAPAHFVGRFIMRMKHITCRLRLLQLIDNYQSAWCAIHQQAYKELGEYKYWVVSGYETAKRDLIYQQFVPVPAKRPIGITAEPSTHRSGAPIDA